jgi:hypothetical protein
MRLPKIQYTSGVQSLGRESVSAPTREANAIANAVERTTSAALNAYAAYDERRTRMETQEASLNAQKAANDTLTFLKGKQYFSAEEVPEDIDIRRTEDVVDELGNRATQTRTRIPAYEVSAEIFRTRMESLIDAQAETITNAKARGTWSFQQKAVLGEKYGQLKTAALAAQQAQIQERQLLNIEEAQEAGSFTLAETLIADSYLTDEQKQEHRNLNNKKREIYKYNADIVNDDLEGLMEDLAFLQGDDYKGHLNSAERLAKASAIKTAIHTITTREDAASKVANRLLKDEAKSFVSVLNKGTTNVDLDEAIALAALLETDPKEFAVESRDLRNAIANYPLLSQFAQASAVQRERILDAFASKKKGAFEAEQFNNAMSIHRQLSQEEARDPVTQALSTGIIKKNEWMELDMSNLAAVLQSRIPLVNRIVHTKGVESGFLTEGETTIIAESLRVMDQTAKQQLIGQVVQGLGDNAFKFFEQLKFAKQAPSFVMAGLAAVEGDSRAASTILAGQAKLDKAPELLSGTETDFLVTLHDKMGTAFINNPEMMDAVMTATKAAYVQLAYERGSVGNTKVNVIPDIMGEAFDLVTGGVVEYGNQSFMAPVRGMSSGQFEDWVDGLEPEVIGLMDEPRDMTRKQLLTGIQKETYSLISTGVRGLFFVKGPSGTVFSMSNEPFVFAYDRQYGVDSANIRSAREAERIIDTETGKPHEGPAHLKPLRNLGMIQQD